MVGQADPNLADACIVAGNRALVENRPEEAITHYLRAAEIKPDHASPHYNLAVALAVLGRLDEAIARVRHALALDPNHANAHLALGRFLEQGGALDAARCSYEAAIRLNPANATALNRLGGLLKGVGYLDQAVDCYRRAAATDALPCRAYSNVLYALLFQGGHGPGTILEEHRRWAASLPDFGPVQPYPSDRTPARRLRLAYLGPYFRAHVVGRNFAPVLARHDRSQFAITLYSNSMAEDELTRQMRSYGDRWVNVLALSDDQLANQIRRDRIDILVDMAQHLDGNRMLALARKPAPVQVAHWGYPATTGLPAMDYRISDPHLDPPGESDGWSTEKIIRLPHSFWCYMPESNEPAVSPLPALAGRQITFGSLNIPCKSSPDAVAIWATVLHRVPGSRMMLLVGRGSGADRYFIDSFSRHGIAPERLAFQPKCPREEYLAAYNHIDIGLDPLPYTGHTTSCDSFWMGVPVITLVGQTSVSRGGASLLHNLGLPELVAATPQQYVEMAAGLAADLPGLSQLRSTLRQRMQASPVMDAESYTRSLESAYWQMWRACTDGPAFRAGELMG